MGSDELFKKRREARKLVKKAKIFYQNVWIVFDKDDFTDFDQAVQEEARKSS